FQRTIRYHSPQRVLEDIGTCIRNNIRNFFFCDPNFTFDKKRTMEIMDGIIKKRWEINIWCETRVDLVDIDMLAKMAKGGVKWIAYGLESADKKVLKAINKKIDLEQFRKIVKMTQDLGIEAEVFTIYGLPKQTYGSACQTLEFIKDLKVKMRGNSQGQQLSLYFGTDIYDNPEKFGIHIINKQRPLFLSPAATFETEYMNRQDISGIRRRCELESFLDTVEADKVNLNELENYVMTCYSIDYFYPQPNLLKIVF
ncbi:MAG: radical SAM protein, partial [Candidatus Omnitrophica bacterium]|nr:radical SAM protein [Candidatus Omnitrophota bacterium]